MSKTCNRRIAVGVALSCALLFVATLASANGRFPRAQRLIQSSDFPNVLALYGTYGLMVTEDAGKTWHYVCEAATGTYGGEDPLLEILPGTKIVARTETALVASQSSWCDFRSIYGNGTDSIADITRDPAQPNGIVALLNSYDKATGFTSHIVQTADAGKTWSTPVNVPSSNISQGLSLDLAAPSGRLYVTGLDSMGKGAIASSDDRGQHWTAHAIPGAGASATPYLAFISAKNADTIYVRTDAYVESDGIDTANDSLLVSTDAGATWQTVITRHAKLFGVALSPDERTLLAGYGDPQIPATSVDMGDTGLYSADVATLLGDLPHGEMHFTKIFASSVTCLRWTMSGLYACTLASETGFEVGRAADASFTMANSMPFTPTLLLTAVAPLPCGSGTSAFGCYMDPVNGFPGVCSAIGAMCQVTPPPPGTMSGLFMGQGAMSNAAGAPAASGGTASIVGASGTTSSSSGGTVAASGGATGGSATAGFGAAGVSNVAGVSNNASGSNGSASCGCRTGRRGGSAAVALVALGLAALRRQRKRRAG